jgi:hypothetical protein
MEVETYERSREEIGSGASDEFRVDLLEIRIFGGSMKLNLICTVPVAGVNARAETRFAENGCNSTPRLTKKTHLIPRIVEPKS